MKYGVTRDYGLETAHEESFDYTAHTQKLSGLEPSTTYHYAVVSMDKAGNRKVSKDFTFATAQGGLSSTPAPESTPEPKPTAAPTPAPTNPPAPQPTVEPKPTTGPRRPPRRRLLSDTAPPKVLDISVTDVTRTSATITWTLDEPATGRLEYGQTTAYGSMTTKETSFDYITHAQTISGLEPGTKYHFRALSEDAAGNSAASSDGTFYDRRGSHPGRHATPRPRRWPRPGRPQRPHRTPTPAPANTVNLPSSIDATGSRDVSAELNAFIRNAPNGSTIVFKAGGTYRTNEVVRVLGKKRITLDGNGATLKLTGPIDFLGAGIFVEQLSEDITIRDLNIVGQHAAAGTKDALGPGENHNAIAVYGSTNVLIERVDIRRVGGDCLYVSAHERRIWSDGVTFRDSTCRLTGRMGVTVIAGSRIRVVNNTFDEIGYAVVGSNPTPATRVRATSSCVTTPSAATA